MQDLLINLQTNKSFSPKSKKLIENSWDYLNKFKLNISKFKMILKKIYPGE
jgi:hypothetical protein